MIAAIAGVVLHHHYLPSSHTIHFSPCHSGQERHQVLVKSYEILRSKSSSLEMAALIKTTRICALLSEVSRH